MAKPWRILSDNAAQARVKVQSQVARMGRAVAAALGRDAPRGMQRRLPARNARSAGQERGSVSVEPFERLGRGFGLAAPFAGECARAWAPETQAQTAVFASALLLEVFATLFGGASQTNALSLMAVELASLPLLLVSIYLILARAAPPGSTFPLALLAAIVLVPLLQIAPLPFQIWRQLPGRELLAQALGAANLGHPAQPFSLAPQQTWRALLALAPPAAMFLGALMLTDAQRRLMAALWLALAVASLCLGGLQMLGGSDSALYFYEVTNAGSPVGFFSNRNHQAAFLLCLLPIAAMFAAQFRRSVRRTRGRFRRCWRCSTSSSPSSASRRPARARVSCW